MYLDYISGLSLFLTNFLLVEKSEKLTSAILCRSGRIFVRDAFLCYCLYKVSAAALVTIVEQL